MKRGISCSGFALPDLLVLSVAAFMMFGLFSGALARMRSRAQATLCVSHSRQMMAAVALYAGNYNGLFPPNEDNSGPQGYVWFLGIASIPGDESSPFDPEVNLLAPFAPDDENIFQCPSDPTTQAQPRSRLPRVRSVAMNAAVGTVCPTSPTHSGAPTLAPHAPWLDGAHSHTRGRTFRTFRRESDLVLPGDTWVMADEDPLSINDGSLGTPGYDPANPGASVARWVDFPGAFHERGGTFAWADGHAQIKRWRALRPQGRSLLPAAVTPALRPDWEWLGQKATQPLR